ncbi:MAG: methyl-accepting chemotaxis protein [Eubacterium sp.]|nr:methyl-accepting chemotaxis protein [Eubacterium sp.]
MKKRNGTKKVKASGSVKNRQTIAGKLLAVLVPMIAVFIVIVAAVIFLRARSVIVSDAQESLSQESRANAADIAIQLENIRGYYSAMADSVENIDFGGLEGIYDNYIFTTTVYENMYPGFHGGLEDGSCLDLTGWVPDADFDVTSRPWYQEALGKTVMTWLTPYVDASTGEMIVPVAREITLPDGRSGVIAADLYLTNIANDVAEYTPAGTGHAILIDGANTILANQNTEYNGTILSDHGDSAFLTAIAEALAGETDAVMSLKGDDGGIYYVSFDSVPNTSWTMVSYVAKADVLAELNRLLWATFAMVVIMLILSTVIIIKLVQAFITTPISKLTQNIISITDNDFTVEIEEGGQDEIGLMNKNMRQFILNMRDSLTSMRMETEQLSEMADTSKNSSEKMSMQAKEQSTSMEQIRGAMDGMSGAVTDLATSASELADMVNDLTIEGNRTDETMKTLVQKADKGQKDMCLVTSNMTTISDSMRDMNNVVTSVEESANRINGIVEMINSIAGQTNLLSLNASIEAARAGEAGKGFAVVATEIGSLANDSADASREIGMIIEDVMKEISDLAEKSSANMEEILNSVDAVETAQTTFKEIFSNLDLTSDSMRTMINKMSEINDIASSVAAISEEQSASSQEVSSNVELLAVSAEEVADESQSVTDSADTVSKSAATINNFVSTFKLN